MIARAILASLVFLLACSPSTQQTPGETPSVDRTALIAQVDALADRYYQAQLEHFPEVPYFAGIPTDVHDRLRDNSLAGIAAWQRVEDGLLAEVGAIDSKSLIGTPAWVTHGVMLELLEASRGLRVCRTELWRVNQMGGWHETLPRLGAMQPVGTPDLRAQAIARWKAITKLVEL